MKKNKGFTLVELLAVIVVIGIITVIVTVNLMGQKKEANIKEAKMIEKQLEDIGASIYTKERLQDENNEISVEQDETPKIIDYDNITDSKRIELASLSTYMENVSGNTVENPFGGKGCPAYLIVTKTNEGPEFKAYIDCGEKSYKTEGFDEKNLQK